MLCIKAAGLVITQTQLIPKPINKVLWITLCTIWSKHNEHNSAAKSLGIWSKDVMQPSWADRDNLHTRSPQIKLSVTQCWKMCSGLYWSQSATETMGKSNQVKLKQGLIILCSGREFSPSSWLVREVVRGLMRLEKKKVLQFIKLDSFSWVNFFFNLCLTGQWRFLSGGPGGPALFGKTQSTIKWRDRVENTKPMVQFL